MQKKISKCLILLSGGQDSTTCLYWAKESFEEIHAVSFYYGQKHHRELLSASVIADKAGVKSLKEIHISNLIQANNEGSLRNTPARNSLFLTIAGIYANSLEIQDLITGVSQAGFYLDCRRTFIDSQQLTLSLALGKDIRIHTPLMYKNNAEVWKMGKQMGILDIIINDTMTDYNGSEVKNEWGMGIADNHASQMRRDGYYEAKEKGWI